MCSPLPEGPCRRRAVPCPGPAGRATGRVAATRGQLSEPIARAYGRGELFAIGSGLRGGAGRLGLALLARILGRACPRPLLELSHPLGAQAESVGDLRQALLRPVRAAARRDEPFDVVHDHSGYTALAMANRLDIPLVHTVHAPFNAERPLLCRPRREGQPGLHQPCASDRRPEGRPDQRPCAQPDRRGLMAGRPPQASERVSPDRVAAAYEAVYREARRGRGAAQRRLREADRPAA
jgi:Glycosyltransferase Family 4